MAGFVCPRCENRGPRGLCNYGYEELGIEGVGTMSEYHCDRCGADFAVYVPADEDAEVPHGQV